ncbi:endonuclease/exonuclease/phosphatase family protein [Marinimicrococcus flavescens]|uniref:Endonuclease/exonuclease/phosphatase family protein n=1 Tax=Marinimicrococcus flavescens TaxID=3031815 RepID=A0AAP3V1E6_9PROT|nr:endonuclease/exonuclease/phosphatase family protein [Marinimicrococcus flavescens]
MLRGVIWIFAAIALLATLLPVTPFKAWWVRAWDFPRVQVACLIVLVLLAMLIWRHGLGLVEAVLAGLLVLALGLQLARILPYTPLWSKVVVGSEAAAGEPARRLRLLAVNVLMSNREIGSLPRDLTRHDPDLVLALEVDEWWVQRLSELLPEHQHRVLHPLDNTYGMALFSRLDLVHPQVRFLLSQEIPSIRTGVRLESGETITFYGIHPEPPSPTEADSSLPRDAELVMVGKEAAKESRPVVVAGDLNDVAWSHTSRLFTRISGLLDPRIGRGFYSTFHAGWPVLRWPLDHVFHSDRFTLRELHRLPAFGSDHFPIFIALDLVPAAAAMQDAEEADEEDHQEAEETVEEAREP